MRGLVKEGTIGRAGLKGESEAKEVGLKGKSEAKDTFTNCLEGSYGDFVVTSWTD
jgi:hypothetical protein